MVDDIIVYRIGYTTEDEDFSIAKWRTDELMERILLESGADQYKVWLSDSLDHNFRYEVFHDYKANRTGKPKPRWHEEIKEYLIMCWDARISFGQEADDALGIAQDKENFQTVICTIDKDLLQVPGNHYNFVKQEGQFVTREQGLRTFYKQLLTGDTTDNIRGCPGIGPRKADRILGTGNEEVELCSRMVSGYWQYFNRYWKGAGLTLDQRAEVCSTIETTARLIKIRQKEDEPLWTLPIDWTTLTYEPEKVDRQSSTPSTRKTQPIQSKEPTGTESSGP